MSKALDTLNKSVTDVIKNASGKSFTKDELIELIDDQIRFLRNDLQFFTCISDVDSLLRQYVSNNAQNTKLASITIYNRINAGLNTAARRANNERFMGAFADTLAGLIEILDTCNDNIDSLFADKSVTIFNTKISQVAVFGMLDSARIFGQFVVDYINLFMSDRDVRLFKPAPYSIKNIESNVDNVIAMINRIIGGKLSKSFVASLKKYRSSGSDTNVVGADNKASTQFAKINNDVTDSDIMAGSHGLAIFKWLGDWMVDRTDRKIRKLRAERDMLQARAQLLQLELDGADEDSPEVKRQIEIIKNYQKLIDRLNQRLAEYGEE